MTTSTADSSELERLLRTTVASDKLPTDIAVVYSDMHGLHGGLTLEIRSDGVVSTTTHPRQAPEPTGQVDSAARMQLIELLVELEAWKQMTPPRIAVPDESRAHVRIDVGNVSGGHWEWFNEMSSNNRLARIRDRLVRLAKSGSEP